VPGPTGPTGAASTVPGPTGPTGATGAASTVPGPTGPTGATGPSEYYTTHTIAIKGDIPSNTYFPGFVIDGTNGGTQNIVRVTARTRTGTALFKIYRRTSGSDIDSAILPATGDYQGTTTGTSYTISPFLLSDQWYVYIKTSSFTGVSDLSVTITVKHT